MAEFTVYKNPYQNQVTSIIGDDLIGGGSFSANHPYPLYKIDVKYWGTILNGSLPQFDGNDYIDYNVFKIGYTLPGTEESIQGVGWNGTKPYPIMRNKYGLWAYIPVCIKGRSSDSYSVTPKLFLYKDGVWEVNAGGLNLFNNEWANGGEITLSTKTEAINRYNSVIVNSSVGYLYNDALKRVQIFTIYANREWLLSDTFNSDTGIMTLNWTETTTTGPDTPGPAPSPEPIDPYQPGGSSGEGTEPPGTFDDTSDAIPDSSLPTLSAANTGFTRIYNPTLSQVQDLARYLWTDETVIQTIWNHIKQYFEDPMQAIIGFNLVPCAVPDAGSQSFALMYIDTGVQMNVAANQFVDVDCGSVKLDRYYGSALDQSPYTRVSCFLPFIGTVKLNTDEVMGTTLQVKYRIDICSGSCVAKIAVDGNIIYQYSGHCAINIPISSADFSSYVQATMSIAKLAVGAAVGGAMGAMAATSTEPSQQTNRAVTTTRTETSTERNPTTGRQVTAGTSTVTTREETHSETSTKASFDYLTPSNIANTVGQVMSSKPIVEHTGSFSGNSGYLGVRRPFLIIERPNMCLPEKYQQFNGYPSMITMKLGDCNGYTRLQQVQLTGMTATNPEQAELMGLLKSGVIF